MSAAYACCTHGTAVKSSHWIFNDHRKSGPRFNISSERQCLLLYPHHYSGVLGPTYHRVRHPTGLTNTSSSSFPRRSPSKAQHCLASVANQSWTTFGCGHTVSICRQFPPTPHFLKIDRKC